MNSDHDTSLDCLDISVDEEDIERSAYGNKRKISSLWTPEEVCTYVNAIMFVNTTDIYRMKF